MLVVHQVFSADVMSVLRNWLGFIQGIGAFVLLSRVVVQISGYKYPRVSFICNLSLSVYLFMYFPTALKYFPVFCIFITYIVSVVASCVRHVFSMI
jgi:hypothetical protein